MFKLKFLITNKYWNVHTLCSIAEAFRFAAIFLWILANLLHNMFTNRHFVKTKLQYA